MDVWNGINEWNRSVDDEARRIMDEQVDELRDGSAWKSNTESRHQQQTEPAPAANVFRKAEQVMCKLCNGCSPIPKAIKQPVWSMLLLVVHQLGTRFPITFPGGWQMAVKVSLECWKAGTEIDATTNRRS